LTPEKEQHYLSDWFRNLRNTAYKRGQSLPLYKQERKKVKASFPYHYLLSLSVQSGDFNFTLIHLKQLFNQESGLSYIQFGELQSCSPEGTQFEPINPAIKDFD